MGVPARVLLVDDPAVAELTATYLTRLRESLETTVETAPSSALDRLSTETFDCVVSEYELGEMDGLAFFEEVRDRDPDVPFILFTGSGSEELASEAISAGVTDYFRKGTGTEQYEVLANRIQNVVDQHHAQREAEEANERVRRLFERVTDGFYALDDDWEFQYVNEQAAELMDADAEELVGEDLREAFPETVGSEFHEAYKEAFETQEPTTVEAEMSHNDGTWVEARAYPSEDGISVYGRDVTERKRMEQELRETKTKIEALYDVAARVVSCTSADEIYDLAIEVAEDILEFDFCGIDVVRDGELVQHSLSETVSNDGYYESVSIDADSLVAEAYRTGETSLIHDLHDGEYDPAESEYRSALTVPLGEFAVMQAASEEPHGFDDDDRELAELLAAHLTEALRRIESERALRAERDRFAALFENVPNAVASCVYEDGDPIVQAVNPAFEETFGWDADTIVGEVLDEYVVPEESQDEADELNERVVSGDHVRGAEVRRTTTDGLRDFLLNTASVRGNDETEEVTVYTDITEQKERERKLARQNERLDEFASVISHDLRNPLNVAQGHFDLLIEECKSPHLPPIQDSLDRMEALIENLLALARKSGSEIEAESVDLASLAQRAWTTAETAEADLYIEGDVTVEVDPNRTQQLLENVFRNSVEHAGRDVSVRIGSLPDGGFYVEDDGPGIPESERDQIFEHGFTTNDEGTGFGLSIVADAAEAHGWSVEVTEGEDGGARFEFWT